MGEACIGAERPQESGHLLSSSLGTRKESLEGRFRTPARGCGQGSFGKFCIFAHFLVLSFIFSLLFFLFLPH